MATVRGFLSPQAMQFSLGMYERQLQSEQAMRELDKKYGINRTIELNAGVPASSGTGGTQSNTPAIGLGGIDNIEDITKQAKDLAQFRLGLDFQGMDKTAALRETESANNFGRTQKLTDQTFNWQRLINQDTEGARTQRNTDQLNTQKELQSNEIGQENFAARRAIGLASRRLGG